jgi:hypothetical protein
LYIISAGSQFTLRACSQATSLPEFQKNNKKKRADERRKQKEAQANSTYEDYNWVEMFHARTLNKCTVAVSAFFLENHSLMRKRKNKIQKIQIIQAWLANSEVNLDQNEDRGKSNEKDNDVVYNDEELDSSDSDIEDDTSDLDDNQHVVLREVGHSTTAK